MSRVETYMSQNQYDDLQEEIAARDKLINNVVDMLDELRLPHSTCDDCWYSCPKSEDGCCNDDVGTECNCGADEHNSIIDKLINQAREVVK